MKVEFTVELINKIVKAAANAATVLSTDPDTIVVESVEGVDLSVRGSKTNLNTFNSSERITTSIYYGEVMLATGIDLNALLAPVNQYNPLYFALAGAFGPQTEMLGMNDVIQFVHRSALIKAITSEKETISPLINGLGSDFSIRLPGSVVFSRNETSLLVIKGEDEVFNLTTTQSHLIDYTVQAAAQVALSLADPINVPARVVDTSIESYLFNSVLYQKTADGKVSFVFDDERTRIMVSRQRGLNPQYGTIIDPNQHQALIRNCNNLYPGYNSY